MPSMTISGNFRTFPRRLEAARKQFRECLDQAMAKAIETGVEFGKNAIETRGTGKTWQRPWGGRVGSFPGRVDTGEMLREFRGEVDIGRTETVGKVGWTKEQLDRFLYQELGFTHNLTNEEVEGMYALRDAAAEAWEVLQAECSSCSSRFIRSI
jgi:hypothetical protein